MPLTRARTVICLVSRKCRRIDAVNARWNYSEWNCRLLFRLCNEALPLSSFWFSLISSKHHSLAPPSPLFFFFPVLPSSMLTFSSLLLFQVRFLLQFWWSARVTRLFLPYYLFYRMLVKQYLYEFPFVCLLVYLQGSAPTGPTAASVAEQEMGAPVAMAVTRHRPALVSRLTRYFWVAMAPQWTSASRTGSPNCGRVWPAPTENQASVTRYAHSSFGGFSCVYDTPSCTTYIKYRVEQAPVIGYSIQLMVLFRRGLHSRKFTFGTIPHAKERPVRSI